MSGIQKKWNPGVSFLLLISSMELKGVRRRENARGIPHLLVKKKESGHGCRGGKAYVWFRAFAIFILVDCSDRYDATVFLRNEEVSMARDVRSWIPAR
jgi:hypothetical protein